MDATKSVTWNTHPSSHVRHCGHLGMQTFMFFYYTLASFLTQITNYLRYRTEFSYTCQCFLWNTALNEGALTCLPRRTIQHAKYYDARASVYHANRHRIGHATGTGLVMQMHRSCKCERSYHHPAL